GELAKHQRGGRGTARGLPALLIASLHGGQIVKRSALILLIIGNVVASQAYGDPVSTQPLTRADCDKAGLAWNDNANVCRPASEVARTIPKPGRAERSGQPLTKSDCDKASMRWDARANECREEVGRQ